MDKICWPGCVLLLGAFSGICIIFVLFIVFILAMKLQVIIILFVHPLIELNVFILVIKGIF